jgi:uncharacterized membrane protein YccF (DUF307 family)
LVGLWSAISNLVLGIACCITIIGIPFGLQYFKFIKLVFAPAGKIVVLKYTRHPIMNTIWLILGGFAVTVSYYVLGALFLVTIIGAPIAHQLFKIANFNFAPFGAEVLYDGEYSKKKNLSYDYRLLMRRIARDPQKVIRENADGTKETVLQRLQARQASFVEINQKIKSWEKKESLVTILTVVICLVLTFLFKPEHGGYITGLLVLDVVLFIVLPVAIVMIVFGVIKLDKYCTFYEKLIGDLMEYYPIGSPEAAKVYTFEQFAKAVGVILPMDVQNDRRRF